MAQTYRTLPPDFETEVHRALKLWSRDVSRGSPLDHLALVQAARAGGMNVRQATNHVLSVALERLATDYPQDAGLLRQRFVEGRPVFAVAHRLNVAEQTLYKMQRRAFQRLAGVLHGMELEARAGRQAAFEQRVPPATYTHLIGIEPHLQHLSEVLVAPGPPWLVAIEGLGGVGKTSLARQLLHRLVIELGRFDDFAWASAQQHQFLPNGSLVPVREPALTAAGVMETLASQLDVPADPPQVETAESRLAPLQQRLRRSPHLLVVDNLETLHDVRGVLPMLRRLAAPSKFLLASRWSLQGEPDVYRFVVPELSQAGALQLIRQEARLRNLPHVSAAADRDLFPIYEAVGGNPLALKLVVGQLNLLSLPQVVAGSSGAQGPKADQLYNYIYWRAWEQLDEDARELLALMPLWAHEGADLATIEQAGDLRGTRLIEALERLVNLSLVNVSGDLRTRRYSIHRLTETFVLREVLQWEDEEL